jgi:hypothetical protein
LRNITRPPADFRHKLERDDRETHRDRDQRERDERERICSISRPSAVSPVVYPSRSSGFLDARLLTLAYDLCEAARRRRRRRRRKTRSKRKACHALSFLRRSCGGVAVIHFTFKGGGRGVVAGRAREKRRQFNDPRAGYSELM